MGVLGGGVGSGVLWVVCVLIECGSDIVCGYWGDYCDVVLGGVGFGVCVCFWWVLSVCLWFDLCDWLVMD